MINVLTHRILVKPENVVETQYKTSIPGFEVVGEQKDKAQKGVDKGVVAGCGPTAFKDFGVDNPLTIGDTIVYARFAGKEIIDPEDPETKYIALNDEDVIAILKNGA